MRREIKTRRGVLALTGGALAALAGCVEGSSDNEGSSGDDSTVTTSASTPTPSQQFDSEDFSEAFDTPVERQTDTPTEAPSEDNTTDYNQTFEKTTNVEGGLYYAATAGFRESFILQWTVENELNASADFDVFLFSADEFGIYDDMIQGDSRRPRYFEEGTVQGIEESASRTVTLAGGDYVLVVDNSDYGDAGDFGKEDTRRVTVTIETRKA